MKKILSLFAASIILFLAQNAFAFDVAVSNTSANPGQQVSVTVNFSDNTLPIFAVDGRVQYDSNVLQLDNITVGTTVASLSLVANTTTPGTATLAMFGFNPVNAASGQLATLNFTVKAAATPGPSLIHLAQMDFSSETETQSVTVNTNGTLTVNGVISNQPPTVTEMTNQTVVEGQSLDVTVSATDSDNDPLTYLATSAPAFTHFSLAGHVITLHPLAGDAGTYTFTVTVDDGHGHAVNKTFTVTVALANQPPTVTAITNKTVTAGQTLEVAISATDPDNDALTYSVTSNPNTFTHFSVVGNVVTVNPLLTEAGNYTLTVTVDDGHGHAVNKTFTVTVAVANQPPVVTTIQNTTVTAGQTQDVTINATDPENDPLTYLVTSHPDTFTNFNVTGNVITLNPVVTDAGSYTLSVVVDDGQGHAINQTFTLTVAVDNRAPVVTAMTNETVTVGQTLDVAISAIDPDNDSLIYSVTSNPSTFTHFNVEGNVITLNPIVEEAGNYTLTVTVDDGHDHTISTTFTLTVDDGIERQAAQITRPAVGTINPIIDTTLSWTDHPGQGALAYFVDIGSSAITTRGSGEVNGLLPLNMTTMRIPETFILKSQLFATLWTQIGPGTDDWLRHDVNYQIRVEENSNVTAPEFSQSGGLYDQAITLTLTSEITGAVIVYTTDGSEPLATLDGTLIGTGCIYNGPITVGETTTIRARVISPTGLSKIVSNTYFINAASQGLGIFSLVTNPANLFDAKTGIYVKGDSLNPNYFQDIPKPVEVSFYDQKQTAGYFTELGQIQISGERASRTYPQKSVQITTTQTIEQTLFDDKFVHELNSFILANGSRDWTSTLIRNALAAQLAQRLKLDYSAYRPVVGYINGQYWGIHQLRESVNAQYFKNNFNLEGNNVDLIDASTASPISRLGDLSAYTAMMNYLDTHDLSQTVNYEVVSGQLDIDRFVDAMSLQIYSADTQDDGAKNLMWRQRSASGLWRPIIFDTNGFGLSGSFEHDTLGHLLTDSKILSHLLMNDAFKKKFINRLADHINAVLSTPVLNEVVDKVDSDVTKAIPGHIQKWQTMNLEQWKANVNAVREFITKRGEFLTRQIISHFNLQGIALIKIINTLPEGGDVMVNSFTINQAQWEGTYFVGVPVALKAVPKPGFEFQAWSMNGQLSTSSDVTVNPVEGLTMQAVFRETGGNHAPVLEPLSAQTLAEGQTLDVPVTAVDADGDALTLTVESNPPTFTHYSVQGQTIQLRPGLADAGAYMMTAIISDGHETSTQSFLLTVTDVVQAHSPVIEPIADQAVKVKDKLTVDVSVSDPDADPVTLTVSVQPATFTHFTLNGRKIKFTPGANDAGNYVVTVRASDGNSEAATRQFNLTVTADGNNPPVIQPIADQTVNEGERVGVDIDVSDPDGERVELSVTVEPSKFNQFKIRDRKIRFSPDFEDAGVYTVHVIATDKHGVQDSKNFILTVVDVNRSPKIKMIKNKTVGVGKTLIVEIDADDPDNDPLTYEVTSSPSSFTHFVLDGKTIRIVPDSQDTGKYVLSVKVSDGQGHTVVEPFKLTVGDLFLRGDANNDGRMDLRDAFFIQQYLFNHELAPAVPDAADANDDGVINFRDVRQVVWASLSRFNRSLPAPFPHPGVDPTTDNL